MKGLPRTITEAAALLRRRETNALELAEIALRAAHADGFNTWLLLSDERAKAQARAADERLRAGDASLLCGIPWACKDIIGTKGVATTAGSKILESYVPPYSVVVPGTRPKDFPAGTYQLGCALIIGRRSEQTDMKTSLNDVLREYEIG